MGQGLQREHASVENIVRLVMEAGPLITDVEDPPTSKVNSFSKEAEAETRESVGSDVVFKEKDEIKASVFESLTLQSSLKAAAQHTTSGTEDYAMTTPVADVRLLTSEKAHYCFWNGGYLE